MAEQQRAKSETEAMLAYAAARPRNELESLESIQNSCQRPGLAANCEYCFSRGGTEIIGANIDLLEVIAGHWRNLEFGFRELSRRPGVGGKSGESVLETFAWDVEKNVRTRRQFTVPHVLGTKRGPKTLTDPTDIYYHIANQAQRRVRTCLENIIPTDIVQSAREECHKTMLIHDPVTPEKIKAMLEWFAEQGVAKDAIEAFLQRRMDAITPAQLQKMRRIVRSIKDGLSEPKDWFDLGEEPEQSAADRAKAAMRKTAKKKPATEPQPQPPEATDKPVSEPPEPEADTPPDEMSRREKYLAYVEEAGTVEQLDQWLHTAESSDMLPGDLEIVRGAIEKRKEYLSRGERLNG